MEQPRRKKKKQKKVEQKAEREKDEDNEHACPPKNEQHDSGRLKKDPAAPKRFKSPYILFSISRMKEYRSQYSNEKVTSLSSRISEDWKALSDEHKEFWSMEAERDKARYEAEKAAYKGPWKVPCKKRGPKDPTAPRRPPSAFLIYCKLRRRQLSRENPGVKNTDISKMLGKEWTNATDDVKRPYLEQEQHDREEYYREMAVWRSEHPKEKPKPKKQKVASSSPDKGAGHDGDLQKIKPSSPDTHRVVKAHGQSYAAGTVPDSTSPSTSNYTADWRMFVSTSMSLKPVPIARAPVTAAEDAVSVTTAPRFYPGPSSKPQPLPILPRKVTLDTGGSDDNGATGFHEGRVTSRVRAKGKTREKLDSRHSPKKQSKPSRSKADRGNVTGKKSKKAAVASKDTGRSAKNPVTTSSNLSVEQSEEPQVSTAERSIVPYRPLDPMIAALGVDPPAPAPSESICYEDDNDIPILMPFGK
mmetsp:Transcript_59474/g.145634  ORF Transcript_59474/g.145634 Transcript_59474/m.145634 type:complete len:472 (+) Transcript_59474:4745-6160(+)